MEITAINLVIFMSGLIIITSVIMLAIYAIHREHQGDGRIIRRLGGELVEAQEALRAANERIEQLTFDLTVTQQNRAEADEEVTRLSNRLSMLATELSLITETAAGVIRHDP